MIYYLLAGCLAYGFFKMDGHLIISDIIKKKYTKFRSLNTLVETRHTNRCKVFVVSVQIVLKSFYLGFLQYINNSVKKLDKNTFEVSYMINGRLYKMLVTPERGPYPILQIINDEMIDVTDQILPYLGPEYDWHNKKLSPKFFGYHSLTFELSNGSELTYSVEEHVEMLN